MLFRELIIGITRLATGHDDYAGLGRVANPHVPWLGPWFLLIVPALGGDRAPLQVALDARVEVGVDAIPVTDPDGNDVVGWVTSAGVLRALQPAVRPISGAARCRDRADRVLERTRSGG